MKSTQVVSKFGHDRVRRGGFTLIELSIALVILSVMLSAVVTVVVRQSERTAKAVLKDRMDEIESALQAFRKRHNRLPCPADGSRLDSSQYFGIEAAVPGTCTGGTPAVNASDSGSGGTTVFGAVPTKTLGLSDDYQYDAWDIRYIYAVDARATAVNAFTTYTATSTAIGSITVTDPTGANRTTKGVAVLLSFGPNGHGGRTKAAAVRVRNSSNASELANCHCNATGTYNSATAWTPTFVQKVATATTTDARDMFDDVVRYYTRGNFLSSVEAAPSE